MRVFLSVEELKRVLKLIDKTVGTVEKTNRIVGFKYENGFLNLYGSDGCLSLKAKVSEMNPTTLSFSVPLDILKFFVFELSGNISIYSDGNYVVLKAKDENLKLKTERFSFKNFEERYEELINVPINVFVNDLDFVSSHLEEGSYVDFYFGNKVRMVAENGSIINYVVRDKKSKEYSWRIPYYSARHLIKALSEIKSGELIVGEGLNKLVLSSDYLFNVCGEELDHLELVPLENEIEKSEEFLRVSLKSIRRFLRRAMISGRYSRLKIFGNEKGLYFYAFSENMEYRGHIDISSKYIFQTTTNAYFLRSALNRIGSETLLFFKGEKYLIISTMQKRRFILLPLL
ncbi:hypothetical protein Ob7_00385 [Thermosipho africanus Ob7]|uniref:hypothetical protein n=1 Tax=Thermosipho africanus TaxID=2421 RepID=UPI000E0ACC18|nr:hypothetical protein [Thermosipho africanus]RDI92503.1 hypothetical protein Ob7_00385 [Thermosipho africanus Ob7]